MRMHLFTITNLAPWPNTETVFVRFTLDVVYLQRLILSVEIYHSVVELLITSVYRRKFLKEVTC